MTSLRARFRNIAAGELAVNRLERAVANVVLAQMLPPGAVKGGTAIKLRLGHHGSRFTPDLDVARRSTMDQFIADYATALSTGWAGFTGRLVSVRAAKPVGIPVPYVMQPYDIKVSYHSRAWMTVRLEVGHDEIGDTDEPEFRLAGDLVVVFTQLGLPKPAPVAVLSADHQIAQKLHACSAPGSERAHDLVDLQLLMSEPVDLTKVRVTCERLFVSRRAHTWPPVVHADRRGQRSTRPRPRASTVVSVWTRRSSGSTL
ncbi:MAG: nucleotidyl transferase AbiEii/AbiGii toxin family protein [Dermatophilaceae bacterium]